MNVPNRLKFTESRLGLILMSPPMQLRRRGRLLFGDDCGNDYLSLSQGFVLYVLEQLSPLVTAETEFLEPLLIDMRQALQRICNDVVDDCLKTVIYGIFDRRWVVWQDEQQAHLVYDVALQCYETELEENRTVVTSVNMTLMCMAYLRLIERHYEQEVQRDAAQLAESARATSR